VITLQAVAAAGRTYGSGSRGEGGRGMGMTASDQLTAANKSVIDVILCRLIGLSEEISSADFLNNLVEISDQLYGEELELLV